ncbi:MAG: GAF domain-containing protein [Nitrospinae bacterium]|nr:GAF domain-containing protein [Nitrospinota bacterium]
MSELREEPEKQAHHDRKLEMLLGTVQKEISTYAWQITSQIKRLSQIGIALSSEHDLNKLLEMIVDEARLFTSADAGTLYILEDSHLQFKIMQNDTFKTRMGGTSGKEITLPPVQLVKSNVSAYVALSGETVNIPDVYDAQGFDFTGPRKYDQATGYRSKSMLVVPMRNQEQEIIGVLQLLNAKDLRTGEVVPFADEFVALSQSLASQAAVAITNAKLLRDMENLFDSFVTVMATAIDERSPYTGGHIKRVADLGVMVCETINAINEGKYADVKFSKDQLKEMKIAGWMHDIGKITTPVHVVDKSTKLETIYDRVDLLRQRFMTIEAIERGQWLERKVGLIQSGAPRNEIEAGEAALDAAVAKLKDDLVFLTATNKGGEFLDDSKIARLKEIAAKTFRADGKDLPYLTEDEVANLSIRKGTLLDSERKIMQDHIVVTVKMLEKIPFTKKLANVARFAGAHHEALDGSGYPKGLKGDDIPLEGRILMLVDLYEALTAHDRPYKKPMPINKVFDIMKFEAEKGKLDKDLWELFQKEDIHGKFTAQYDALPPMPVPPPPAPAEQKPAVTPEKLAEAAMGRNPLEKASGA